MSDDSDASEKLDKVLAYLDSMGSRLDAVCSRVDSLEGKGGDDGDDGEDGDNPKAPDEDAGKPVPVLDAYAAERGMQEAQRLRDELQRKERQVAAMMERINGQQLTQKQHQELADAQSRADAAYQAWSRRAPAPIPGELPAGYRHRLAAGLAEHSETWKDFFKDNHLSDQPEDARAMIEAQVFADAQAAARRDPFDLGDGEERMVERRDPDSGLTIREFYRKNHFVADHAPPARAWSTKNQEQIRQVERMRNAARSVGDTGAFVGSN